MKNSKRSASRMTRGFEMLTQLRARALGFEFDRTYASKLYRLRCALEFQFLPFYPSVCPKWRLAVRNKRGGKRTLPDFFVVSAPKCATSDLAITLMMHPNVVPPLVKEPHVGHSWDPERWRLYFPTKEEKNEHAAISGMAMSPIVTPFMHAKGLIHFASQLRPARKIVIALRNPVDRVYSQWKWEYFLTGKQNAERIPYIATFSAFVDLLLASYPDWQPVLPSGFAPLQTSIYWTCVGEWIRLCGKDNVVVLDIAEYFLNRSAFLTKLQSFVNLPVVEIPRLQSKVNENPLRLAGPDEVSKEKLRCFFAQHNRRLSELVGTEFAW